MEALECFEHYSVSCVPCPKNHESVDLGASIYIYIYTHLYKHTKHMYISELSKKFFRTGYRGLRVLLGLGGKERGLRL